MTKNGEKTKDGLVSDTPFTLWYIGIHIALVYMHFGEDAVVSRNLELNLIKHEMT